MKRIFSLIKQYGLRDFCFKSYEKMTSPMKKYTEWCKTYFPQEEELEAQRRKRFDNEPLLSIVVPAYETNSSYLREMLESVHQQTYTNWQLCIADGSKTDVVERTIEAYDRDKEKICYCHLERNLGIAENTNAAIAMATGDYICFFDHDDILAPNALFEMVNALNEEAEAEFFYSDEDKITEDLQTCLEPHFKPDYNPLLLCAYNYICHFVMVKKSLVEQVGGLDARYDGAQDYDYVLRCCEQAKKIYHVPKILYHWRINPNSTAANSSAKDYAFDAGKGAIDAHLNRIGVKGKVERRVDPGSYRVYFEPIDEEEITILDITATEREIEGVKTRYFGLAENSLNVSVEAWKRLTGCLRMPRCGMVAGKIVCKDKIWESGLSYGGDGSIYHLFRGMSKYKRGYQKRAVLQQNISAANLNFVVIDKAIYEAVGGFDFSLQGERRALDFGFRLKKNGYCIALEPNVVVTKKDCTGAADKMNPRLLGNKWGTILEQGDWCWNVNLNVAEGTEISLSESNS